MTFSSKYDIFLNRLIIRINLQYYTHVCMLGRAHVCVDPCAHSMSLYSFINNLILYYNFELYVDLYMSNYFHTVISQKTSTVYLQI